MIKESFSASFLVCHVVLQNSNVSTHLLAAKRKTQLTRAKKCVTAMIIRAKKCIFAANTRANKCRYEEKNLIKAH